jgi:hypothetical protein
LVGVVRVNVTSAIQMKFHRFMRKSLVAAKLPVQSEKPNVQPAKLSLWILRLLRDVGSRENQIRHNHYERQFEIVVDWGIETVDLPTKHTGHGWSIHVDAESVGGVRFARVKANLKELDITAEELGDALRDAMRKLNQEKKPAGCQR